MRFNVLIIGKKTPWQYPLEYSSYKQLKFQTSKTTKLIIIFPQSYSCITTHTHTQPSQNGNPLRYCCPVTVAASKTATLVQTLDPSPFEKPPKRTRFTEVHNVCGTLPEPSAVWPKSASASEVCTHFRLEGGFPSRMKSSGYCLPKDFDHSEEALFSFWKYFFFVFGGKVVDFQILCVFSELLG